MSGAAFRDRVCKEREAALADLADAGRTQARLLLDECVRPNVATAFGVEHRFAEIATIDDYRRRVPIRTYDELAPFIERAAAGEHAVLTAEDPIAFNRTSGTTGAAKKIPVTRSYHLKHEQRRRLIAWGNFLTYHPEVADRPDTTLNLVWDPRPGAAVDKTAGGVLYGAANVRTSYHNDQQTGMPGTHAPWSQVPAEITDPRERSYFRLRLAVEHDLRAIVSLNPSSILALANLLRESFPRLVRELYEGTVLGRPAGAPAPERARELERLAAREPVEPRHLWPHLLAMVCWKSGWCQLYLPELERRFGEQVELMPMAISSSEGPISTSVDRHPIAGPLALFTSLLEFVPVEEDLSADTPTLLYDELKEGHLYQVILTQPAGMYRYAIGDVVRVVGQLGGVPRVEFIERKGAVSSFTGEKLTERQVLDSMQAALRTVALRPRHITCCPVWDDPPHYAFVVELEAPCAREALAQLAAELERQLAVHNDEYPGKRSSGRLGPARVCLVGAGTFDRHRAQRIAGGSSPTQMKEHALHRDLSMWSTLTGLSTAPVTSVAAP